jgi:hypothetical protein
MSTENDKAPLIFPIGIAIIGGLILVGMWKGWM